MTGTPTLSYTPSLTPPFSYTPTGTPTLTDTPTATGTATSTVTPPSTYTPTPTLTTTATPTFPYTATNTPTLTSTPTFTATATSTGTPTPPNVQLAVGGSNPSGEAVLPGTANVPLLQFQLTNTGSMNVTVTSLQVSIQGGSGVTEVSLTLGSLVLGTGSLSSGTAVLNLATPIILGPGGIGSYMVDFSFSTSAQGTYAAVLSPTDVTGVFAYGTANMTGGTLTSNNCVVELATATVTSTLTSVWTALPPATATATATATSTASATSTVTPLPTPTITATLVWTGTPTYAPNVVISPPYPNPSQGGPVVVSVQAPGPMAIKWKIYTLSFRQILEGDPAPSATAQLVWNLTDKAGATVSNGLYYWMVEVTGNGSTTRKVYKVLVLR